ncbi:DUF1799 domain-containing protein [Phenylobacterium ferrooxidans]|uniref:DUF1799 domain-containing protein n=1 Tax=Phenylobacterium ferrooxidans TaxID=2982689 RepID=A0ABW6CKP0_9CAUL
MADFAKAAAPQDDFPILPANGSAVRLFQALQTQWRTTAISTMAKAVIVRTGLDYAVIEPTARLSGLALESDDFIRVRVMETAALNAFHDEAR